MNLREFCLSHKIAIWGAGAFGKVLEEGLAESGNKIVCFIVSDGHKKEPYVNGNEVVEYSAFKKRFEISSIGVIVACNFNYQREIAEQLESDEMNYYIVRRDELPKSIYRKRHPIRTDDLLVQTIPKSTYFGAERGTPIDRYYIDQFLKRAVKENCAEAKEIIEIGEDRYGSSLFPKANNIDLFMYEEGGMDLTKANTYPHGKYDVFICTQTLNFIYDVRKAIYGIYNCLKDNGVALVTVQGNIGQISRHDYDSWGDYWRFTDLGIRKLFAECFLEDSVKAYSYGNVMSATAFIQGISCEDLEKPELLDYIDPTYSVLIGIIAKK